MQPLGKMSTTKNSPNLRHTFTLQFCCCTNSFAWHCFPHLSAFRKIFRVRNCTPDQHFCEQGDQDDQADSLQSTGLSSASSICVPSVFHSMKVGFSVGADVGTALVVGAGVGETVNFSVGREVGLFEGGAVGRNVGFIVLAEKDT